jgi:HK97 family phage major capsid protein
MTTTFATVPYVRELNPVSTEGIASGGANTVPEGATKPNAQLSFAPQQAPVTVIATTLTLSKQMFMDAPAVIAYINQRLPYLVKLREDSEFLNGTGVWPDIMGILNTPGLLTNAGVAGQHAISIGNGFAQVENQDGIPTAVVMNPIDAWAMFTLRAAGGSGTFDAGTPFSALPLTVWGVPTYRSRVYPAGSCLVADFERGAMIVDREAVNLQTYNERYAEQNLVLLICEERLGLMVFRPDLFDKVQLP